MKKYDLLSEIRRRRKWVNMGQQLHRYENLLNRQFHADKPNRKWVTDISYIHTKQGILYLSMIRDLYDNSIVAYKTGTEQTVNLVLDTIRQREKEGRCGVAPPQRPGLSIYIPSIFQANSKIRYNSVHVKTRELLWQCDGRKFFLHSQNRVYLQTQTGVLQWSQWNDWSLYSLLQPRAHPDKDRSDAANATPLRLNFISPT